MSVVSFPSAGFRRSGAEGAGESDGVPNIGFDFAVFGLVIDGGGGFELGDVELTDTTAFSFAIKCEMRLGKNASSSNLPSTMSTKECIIELNWRPTLPWDGSVALNERLCSTRSMSHLKLSRSRAEAVMSQSVMAAWSIARSIVTGGDVSEPYASCDFARNLISFPIPAASSSKHSSVSLR